jgi:hypothetical protein
MRTRLLALTIIWLGYIGSIFGQTNDALLNKSGIYLSALDFSSGKLKYEINCLTQKHKIKSSDFLNTNTIKIVHQDSTIKLLKSAIWGFRLCDGQEYRIYQNKEYEILDKGAIPVYQTLETPRTVNPKNKQTLTKTKHYFSEDASSPLKELTLKNIETSFLSNKKFHELIDLYFKSDEDLLIYDDYYKMLRLNHTYLESLK